MSSETDPGITRTLRRRGPGKGCLAGVAIVLLIMAAGFFAGRGRRTENRKKSEAMEASQRLVIAILSFDLDHQRLPLPVGVPGGKDLDTDTSAGAGVVSALKGFDETVNPRGVDYLGEVKDARVTVGGPISGVYKESEHVAALFDPWGRPYHLRIDGDGDGFLNDPSRPGMKIRSKVLIWSSGKDGDAYTWEDNLPNYFQDAP
jgi:hypothetical protein